ncbi:ARM repeat-containing protein [Neurospora tetrasperma FGSC 2509]|nr:ARM repeat-containing protein [Neurospora tetrasperma FGSC 2509]
MLQELLTKHKDLVPHYLQTNFDLFFSKYNSILIQSTSYVTKRQSIKLLGEILLDRSNYNVMTAYVDRGEHLKICMNLLRDDRKMVQYEGFHVFKVFVANPHKSVPVQKILLMNREKLLHFLSHFLEDRTDDEQFIDEREFLIKQIRNMPPTPVVPQRLQGIEYDSCHHVFAREVEIFSLKHPPVAGLMYLEWRLPDDVDTLQRLMSAFNMADGYRKAILAHLQGSGVVKCPPQRVFVEKKGGWPWGLYTGSLRIKKERILALFIQRFGVPNRYACS